MINPEFKEANAAIEEAAHVFVEKIVDLTLAPAGRSGP